jgi:hypothetical protein
MFKFIFGVASLVGKFAIIMGIGTIMIAKPPFIDTDSHFEVIRSEKNVYQVNYEKDKIDSVEIFDKEGNFKGKFEYNELKGNHKKIIDSAH